jgi:hypothetical protein
MNALSRKEYHGLNIDQSIGKYNDDEAKMYIQLGLFSYPASVVERPNMNST